MKQINTYINEKLRLTAKRTYTCQPTNVNELRGIIINRIKDEGNECDLNDIDTSKITDMSYLFDARSYQPTGNPVFKYFNGDISIWNVSNVKNMKGIFCCCNNFNGDISMWNVSNVKDMSFMFYGCKKFNQDLNNWDVPNVKDMRWMFSGCEKFNQNLDSWNVSNVEIMKNAFENCPTQPTWYK